MNLFEARIRELEKILEKFSVDNFNKKTPVFVAQTTQNLSEWYKTQNVIKKHCTNPRIFDTICKAKGRGGNHLGL